MSKLDKILKKLELDTYSEEPERADFMKYLKFNNYVSISESFLSETPDYSIVGEVLSENRMFSYDEIVDMLELVKFNLKN